MENLIYQTFVKKAFENLDFVEQKVMQSLKEIALSGEFKDIKDLVEMEGLEFMLSDFDRASDPNIHILSYLLKSIMIAKEDLEAWNGKEFLKIDSASQ